MFRYFLLYSVLLCVVWSDPFFHSTVKPSFFCWKVCPLYCSPRRSDEDAASLVYLEDDPYSFSPDEAWVEDEQPFPPGSYHRDSFIYWKSTTTTTKTTTSAPVTTTPAPTTTEEPSLICMVCKKKCNYPKS